MSKTKTKPVSPKFNYSKPTASPKVVAANTTHRLREYKPAKPSTSPNMCEQMKGKK